MLTANLCIDYLIGIHFTHISVMTELYKDIYTLIIDFLPDEYICVLKLVNKTFASIPRVQKSSRSLLDRWAARHGYLQLCQKFHLIKSGLWLYEEAAEHGQLEIVKWLHEQGVPMNRYIMSYAALNDNLDLLEHLHQLDISKDYACESAASKGHVSVLKWLRQHNYSWNEGTCSAAAKGGHLETLQWCHQNGCPWNSHTTLEAACNGRVDILIYSRQQGCSSYPTPLLFTYAVNNGHLDVIKYLIAEGCHCDEDSILTAIACRHIHILLWFKEQGYLVGDRIIQRLRDYGYEHLIA